MWLKRTGMAFLVSFLEEQNTKRAPDSVDGAVNPVE